MITSPNEHIRSYLDYYVGHTEPPGYAVMIAGAWGSGKSWLIRQHMRANSEQKYLYVSLYGAKTADEVAERVFAARHPILTSKGVVIAGRVIKGLLKVTTSVDIDRDKVGDFQVRPDVPDVMSVMQKNPSYDDRTLIFDDVERCLVDQNELWGFINQLVEHEGAKVILLSHEAEIDSKADSYRRTKEKNIGITLTVAPDVDSVLDGLISEAKAAASVLLEYKTQIRILLGLSGCESLRVLRFAVRDFCRIFAEVPSKFQDAPEVRYQLLNSTLTLAYGVYSGALKPADFVPVHIVSLKERKEDAPIDKWLRNFSGIALGSFSPNIIWWRNFFERGELRRPELTAACEGLVDTALPDWLQLANFHRLSDSDFEKLLRETWENLAAQKYRSVGEILHVVSAHMWAIQNQLTTSSLTNLAIQDEAKKAINGIEPEGFLDMLTSDDPPLSAYAGIMYAAHDVAEFQGVLEYVGQICEEQKQALARLKGRRLLKSMTEGGGSFVEALGGTAEEGQLRSVTLQMSVLAEVDPGEFATVLLGLAHRTQEVILGALNSRLKRGMPNEREWVGRVAEKIHEQNSKPSLRSFMLRAKLARFATAR